TEMHYDRTPDKSGAKLVNTENPDVMEIWNDVFIQYNRNPDGSLTPLPLKHVDTGMGFERMCQILQGSTDNYGSDPLHPFIAAIIKDEEQSFDRTIDRGLRLFVDAAKNGTISGAEAFDLHATYGFPIDLTKIIAAERGVEVDEAGYKREFEEHQRISSAGGKE